MAFPFSIISSGRPGADQAALDFAITHGIAHGGWCAKGQANPEGKYQLKESDSEDTLPAIGSNVEAADATVVLTLAPKPKDEAQKALSAARKLKKPCLHLHQGILGSQNKLLAFTDKHYVRRLHITGSDEAKEPGLYEWVTSMLEKMRMEMERRQ